MTRLLVVDDHPVVRSGLVAMLGDQTGIDIVGEAANGAEALHLAASLAVDLVLMDLRMPVMDGIEATERILASGGPPVLVLTTYDTDRDIVRAVAAGACGYLLKDAPIDRLLDTIRRAASGQSVLDGSVVARVDAARRHRVILTSRELDVLRLVAQGRSNAEVGRELFIGEATVKTHLLRVFAKLGVNDRTAAVTSAATRGLIRLE